jgi:hypothetical protein
MGDRAQQFLPCIAGLYHVSAIPVSPQETRVVSKWLVQGAVEGVDFTIDSLIEL